MKSSKERLIARIGESSKKRGPYGTERMKRLLELMGNPEKHFKVVHVAGTNGKGSVSHYISSILSEAGYRAGLYTSPHVMEYNERVSINGKDISDEDFCRLGDKVLKHNEKLQNEGFGFLSEFEVLTAISFLYFKEREIEIATIEVGIGGRNDVTNVFENPLATVITQISKDHEERLGITLSEIAMEKAGIIKHEVPVVSQSSEKKIKDVIKGEAKRKCAEFIDSSQINFCVKARGKKTRFDVSIGDTKYDNLEISMFGDHQIRNAITALETIFVIEERLGTSFDETFIRNGLLQAINIGRFEILRENPTVIIDGAHNEGGIISAMTSLKTLETQLTGKLESDTPALKKPRVLIVFGCMADKDYEGMVRAMNIDAEFIATEPVSERALKASILCKTIMNHNQRCSIIGDEEKAYNAALSGEYDIILFIGSIYLIGDIRKFYFSKERNDYV